MPVICFNTNLGIFSPLPPPGTTENLPLSHLLVSLHIYLDASQTSFPPPIKWQIHSLFHGFKFRIIFLLDWLPPKANEFNLYSYWSHGFMLFWKLMELCPVINFDTTAAQLTKFSFMLGNDSEPICWSHAALVYI